MHTLGKGKRAQSTFYLNNLLDQMSYVCFKLNSKIGTVMQSNKLTNILSYNIHNSSLDVIVDQIIRSMKIASKPQWLACLNPHSYVVACDDKGFSAALHGADWLIPDGMGIVLASRVSDGNIERRVAGFDIFYGLQSALNKNGSARVFFLGSTTHTLEVIAEKMSLDFPNLKVAGTYSPPFKDAYSDCEIDEMVNCINRSNSDVLWVGLTAPKQEKWIFQNKQRLNVKFIGAIGAVFDFYSGNVKRSSPLFRQLGLEWLPRLLQQPHRLWRRVFISGAIFIAHLIKDYFSRR